jgi:hypothetical protein
LQYLEPSEMDKFIANSSMALKHGGILGIDYALGATTLGEGRFPGVKRYHHEPRILLDLFDKNNLETVSLEPFTGHSTHVPYTMSVNARRILVRKY